MKYVEFLERWHAILLKLSWVIVQGAMLLIVGHVIYVVVRVMMSQ